MNNEIVIGAIFFILGLIPAYIFYVKSLRYKEPVYAVKNYRVIHDYESSIPSLKVSYSNKKVKSFSIAQIIFYNRGTETISKQDIDTVNHIRIAVKEGVKILDASIMQSNNPSSLFMVNVVDNEALIDFEYLDKNQGGIIRIMHTGLSKDDLEVVGDIKGANRLINLIRVSRVENSVRKIMENRRVLRFLSIILIVLYLSLIISIIFTIVNPDFIHNSINNTKVETPIIYRRLTGLVFLIVAGFILYFNYALYRYLGIKTSPQGLENFDN